jgi:lipopolysaccharide transport system permease protein
MEKELVITPTRGLSALRLKELWEYRELFYFLVWRDVKVRYKQTVLGAAWAIVKPVVTMVVLTFVFNRLAGFSVTGVPDQLFTFAGVLAWNFFSDGLTGASGSLISNTNLISKVYFPRIIIPAAAVLRGLVDFGIAFVIFLGFMAYYSFNPGPSMILFPVVVVWGIVASLGVGMWFTAIGVKYRDIGQALPFIVQVLFWVTPLGYSSAKIAGKYELLYWLNPMTGVVEGFRQTLLGTAYLPLHLLCLSVSLSIIIFLSGIWNFRRMEREFADII